MNKESPSADAPVPLAGTEQPLAEALDQASQKPEPEEAGTAEFVGDLMSDAFDILIAAIE